jgi:serine/threonine-protein kinase RsbW
VAEQQHAGQTEDEVEVIIPARPEFVGVARLTAAAIAARHGFSYDEIEDLKIAVGEACTSLIISGGDQNGRMTIRYRLGTGTMEVRVEAKAPGVVMDLSAPAGSPRGDDILLDETRMGIVLMQCLVDEADARQNEAEGTTEIRLVKRREQ